MRPAVKPRTSRPHSQYNPITSGVVGVGGESGGSGGMIEQTQMVNMRYNRRSLDCTLSDYNRTADVPQRTAGGNLRPADLEPQRTRAADLEPQRTAGGTVRAAGGSSITAGRSSSGITNVPPQQGGTNDGVRPYRATVSDLNNSNPSGPPDSGNIRRYLTRPWNSENRTGEGEYGPNRSANQESAPTRARTDPPVNMRSYPPESGGITRSRHSVNDAVENQNEIAELVNSTRTSRRNSEDSISNFGLRRTSSVQAKKKFMLGSYVILFVGILLAASGAVLTVLAFHNHFGHISIGQQWSLAGIVLMTIGICLLLTYTVTAAKNKYWAVQEDINLEESRGNYSRNLEQSSSVYIPAPYSRETASEPPGEYHRTTAGEPGGYHRLPRESPSLLGSVHSSAAASTSQFTETSSVDMEDEPRQSASSSHKRTKRPHNYRYDVAGHEVESDTPSEGSLHNTAEKLHGSAGQGRTEGGYRGRALRPAPEAPQSSGDTKIRAPQGLPDHARPLPRASAPNRAAPGPPVGPEPAHAAPGLPKVPDVTRTAPKPPSKPLTTQAQVTQGIPDLIRAVPDGNVISHQGQGQVQGQIQPEVPLRAAPVLPEEARQVRKPKPTPPPRVQLQDLPAHSEVAMPLQVRFPEKENSGQAGKKKGPERPVPPKGVAKTPEDKRDTKSEARVVAEQPRKDNTLVELERNQDEPRQRKPSRPAPEAPNTKQTGAKVGETSAKQDNQVLGGGKPTPAARAPKTPAPQQQQQYCCIENMQSDRTQNAQCSCASGEGGRLLEGLEGPYTGSSDEEAAANLSKPRPLPKPSLHPPSKKQPPPTKKKPTRSYEDLTPPEEGAPPRYDDLVPPKSK